MIQAYQRAKPWLKFLATTLGVPLTVLVRIAEDEENSFSDFMSDYKLPVMLTVGITACATTLYSGWDYFKDFYYTTLKPSQRRSRDVNMSFLIVFSAVVTWLYSFLVISDVAENKENPYGFFQTPLLMLLFLQVSGLIKHRIQMNITQKKQGIVDQLKQSIAWGQDYQAGKEFAVTKGQKVPVDCTLLSEQATVDANFYYGTEYSEVEFTQNDTIFAGVTNLGDTITVRANCNAKESHIYQMLQRNEVLKQDAKQIPSVIRRLQWVARYFPLGITVASAIALLAWGITTQHWSQASQIAIAVFNGGCPCGILIGPDFTKSYAVYALAKNGYWISHLDALFSLNKLNNIVTMDLNGTLAMPTVTATTLSHTAFNLVANLQEKSPHPFATAILAYAKLKNYYKPLVQVTLDNTVSGRGVAGTIGSDKIKIGDAVFCGVTNASTSISKQDLIVFVVINDRLVGHIVLNYTLVADAAVAVKQLVNQGMDVRIITGSDDTAARAIVQPLLLPPENIYTEKTAQQKERLIEQFSEKAPQSIIYLGDGINDTEAAKKADVIIAQKNTLLASLSHIAIPNLFSGLMQLMQLSNKMVQVIYQALSMALFYNITMMIVSGLIAPLVWGPLSPTIPSVAMPLSSLLVMVYIAVSMRWHTRSMQSSSIVMGNQVINEKIPLMTTDHVLSAKQPKEAPRFFALPQQTATESTTVVLTIGPKTCAQCKNNITFFINDALEQHQLDYDLNICESKESTEFEVTLQFKQFISDRDKIIQSLTETFNNDPYFCKVKTINGDPYGQKLALN